MGQQRNVTAPNGAGYPPPRYGAMGGGGGAAMPQMGMRSSPAPMAATGGGPTTGPSGPPGTGEPAQPNDRWTQAGHLYGGRLNEFNNQFGTGYNAQSVIPGAAGWLNQQVNAPGGWPQQAANPQWQWTPRSTGFSRPPNSGYGSPAASGYGPTAPQNPGYGQAGPAAPMRPGTTWNAATQQWEPARYGS